MYASSGPHASYDTVRSWLRDLGVSHNIALHGDIVIAFDNNQVLRRAWNVMVGGKFQCHIITMVAFFELGCTSVVQQNASLKPAAWPQENHDAVQAVKYIDTADNIKAIHNEHLYPFIQDVITAVAEEQQKIQEDQTVDLKDHIDDMVT